MHGIGKVLRQWFDGLLCRLGLHDWELWKIQGLDEWRCHYLFRCRRPGCEKGRTEPNYRLEIAVKIARILSWIAAAVGFRRSDLGRQPRPAGPQRTSASWVQAFLGVRKPRHKHRTTIACRTNRRTRNRAHNAMAKRSRRINWGLV